MTPRKGYAEALRRIAEAKRTGATKLALSYLGLPTIPVELSGCQALQTLNLSANQIRQIENLPDGLQTLDLSWNQISRIENLPDGLQTLDLQGNQISQIENLPDGLQTLYLFENQIRQIENLPDGLQTLYLFENQISQIENLPDGLQTLDLRHNQISRIENLPDGLQTLNLFENQIRQIENLPDGLQILNLWRNPIENFPPELLGNAYDDDCLEDWYAWINDLAQGQITNQTVRLLVIGNGNVGKSSIIEALDKGRCLTRFESTHAIRIETITLAGPQLVTAQVFDFGGQEIYTGTHALFLRGRAVQLIVFDAEMENRPTVRDRITNEPTRNQPLRHWVETIRRQSPDSEFVLVQNKMDCPDKLNPATETFLTTCEDNGMIVTKVSATRGRGIPALHGHLCEAAYALPEYGLQMPLSWHSVRQYFIDNLATTATDRQKLIDTSAFEQLCRQHGVLPGSEPALLRYLHRSGTIYYNEQYLSQTIIADQEWAIKAIYTALDRSGDLYERLRNQSYGKCQARDLFSSLGDNYTSAQRWLLLNFMESCGLCFPVKERDYESANEQTYYIFPEFLPAETPPTVSDFVNQGSQRIFQQTLNFLPYAHVQQLIARWGLKTPIWNIGRTGLYVQTPEGRFALTADLEQHILTLHVDGGMPADWLGDLLKKFAYGNNHWAEITAPDAALSIVPEPPSNSQQDLFACTPEVVQKKIWNTVFSYSHVDERYRNELETHMVMLKREGRIVPWHDRKIIAGERWNDEIQAKFKKADLAILMISAAFLNSDYIWEQELKIVRERLEEQDGVKVIPIFTSSCDTTGLDFMDYQGGQRDHQSKLSWLSEKAKAKRNSIYTNIIAEIRRAIN